MPTYNLLCLSRRKEESVCLKFAEQYMRNPTEFSLTAPPLTWHSYSLMLLTNMAFLLKPSSLTLWKIAKLRQETIRFQTMVTISQSGNKQWLREHKIRTQSIPARKNNQRSAYHSSLWWLNSSKKYHHSATIIMFLPSEVAAYLDLIQTQKIKMLSSSTWPSKIPNAYCPHPLKHLLPT